jgi:hypothetical protein
MVVDKLRTRERVRPDSHTVWGAAVRDDQADVEILSICGKQQLLSIALDVIHKNGEAERRNVDICKPLDLNKSSKDRIWDLTATWRVLRKDSQRLFYFANFGFTGSMITWKEFREALGGYKRTGELAWLEKWIRIMRRFKRNGSRCAAAFMICAKAGPRRASSPVSTSTAITARE